MKQRSLFFIFQFITLSILAQGFDYEHDSRHPYLYENNNQLDVNLGHFYQHSRQLNTHISEYLYNLKGKVRSLEQTHYFESNNSKSLPGSLLKFEFDEKHRITKKIYVQNSFKTQGDDYLLKDSYCYTTHYRDYRRLQQDSIFFHRNDTLFFKKQYEFNNDGICVSESSQNEEGKETELIEKLVYSGDSILITSKYLEKKFYKKKLIKIKFAEKGSFFKDNTCGYFEYNNNGDLIKYSREAPNGHIFEIILFDERGNVIHEIFNDPSKSHLNKDRKWIYNERNKKIKRIDKDDYFGKIEKLYTYKNELLIEVKTKYGGKEAHAPSSKYEFDNYGNLIYIVEKDFTNRYKYKYDSYGNWIEKEVYLDEKLQEMYSRILTYW